MGVLRVTQGILAQRALTNIQNQSRRILELQTQLSTGLRVNTPSDKPIDARRAINTRASIAKNEQYLENISTVSPRLEETVTAIQTMSDNLLRARELTLQGANGTNDQTSLDALAEEINQILEAAVNTANHQTGSLYIFGGTRTTTPAFDVTRDANGDITAVTYQGNTEDIEIAVGDGITVTTNEPGSTVFQGSQDIFQTLIDIRDNLLSGDQASLQDARLTELETERQQLSQAMSRVGAVQNRLERTELELEDFQIQLEELLSDSIDADFAEVVISLNAQSNAFQAALSAAAQVIQPSLLDFIR
ncbi:MAG: flagellar hook-associated protein FlgL [Candidatus Hydrogenedentes bacterium]|nr:flagellar hook-associated protein FlgL [Candidatus Hydrogenedentota bacterium]